jgi:hypothetical protein
MRSILIAALLLGAAGSAEAACRAMKAETDINGVRLGDEDSTARVLGKIDSLPFDQLRLTSGGAGNSILVIFNRDRSEMAVLTQYPGTSPGSFLLMEVRAGVPTRDRSMTISADRLSTEHGVKLGVSEEAMTGMLGPCFTRSGVKGKDTTLRYDIADPNHPYLRRVNMPAYYAQYHFTNGRLASFVFGSDYP